jgi:OOP family OmpA-OmpF porin
MRNDGRMTGAGDAARPDVGAWLRKLGEERSKAKRRWRARATALLGCTVPALLATAGDARAQQQTFHLDRLEVPGAPDDGIALFRPVTDKRSLFFAQLGLGYDLNPLHTRNITSDAATLNSNPSGVIQHQFAQYSTVGFEFLDRVIVSATLPVYWIQSGQIPNYVNGGFGTTTANTFQTGGPGVGDTRLDFRGVVLRSEDRRAALGAQLSMFAPSGTSSNFGGDGSTSLMLMVTGEYAFQIAKNISIIGVANSGVHFRPVDSINSPPNNGLGIGNEWRWAAGAFLPLKDGKYRVGATIFGQTGLDSGGTTGNTFFTKQNTPIEWQAEGRMKFGQTDHFWAGVGAGSRLDMAYGAPDFRIVALIGVYVPILDSDANSPENKLARRQKWRDQHAGDADNDGIPDDIDACPTEPEDHLGNDPSDGCPMPADRDGDGIPDQYDKCPDVPEDKDGIDDGDGCPEDDADHDGIPDTTDACPKEPGQPNPDPKKNGCPTFIHLEGKVIQISQQVHFATNSATILPDSFPMLKEIADLLKANTQIKKMSIEGHTDDRGPDDYNLKLSQARANSVMAWLTQHGIEQGRLEAHGYGEAKPIADNKTEAGRLANRRVEFKIADSEDTNKVQKPQKNEEVP